MHGVPAYLKEDEAHGSHGRLGPRKPTGTDCPQGPKNPEAAANVRDWLSLTNVGDKDLNRVQHSRSPDKIIGATFGKRQVGQADPTRIQSLAGRSNTAKGNEPHERRRSRADAIGRATNSGLGSGTSRSQER